MNIRTTLYSIALFFAAASELLVAQEMPKIIPPSPEAASAFKFTQVPVSLYTGVPNITVPIYEIEARGLTIPINLGYHSRGIQVSEIASQVGLGWSLNYGGMVSRQVRGGKDEGYLGYLGGETSKEDFFTDEDTRSFVYATYVNHNEYDFIPDQFYYSANGLSGKFVFDQTTGLPQIQKFDGTKIAGSAGFSQHGFVLTDGQGNKYYFGKSKDGTRLAIEITKITHNIMVPDQGDALISTPNGPSGDHTPNAWPIMTIETAQGELIEYHYEEWAENSNYFQRSYDGHWIFENIFNPVNNPPPYQHKSHFSRVVGIKKRLSEIRFEKGKLAFTYTNDRQDLKDAKSLDKITLYDHKDIKIKEFDLKYEYTTSPDDSNQNWYLESGEAHAAKRMFLKSVQTRFAGINDTLPKYRFKYNKTVLPNRHSNSQDIWGYYNGKPNGHFLKFIDSPEDSRAVDTIRSQAGMLEKIFTPEGGQTIFHYEHNKIINTEFPSSVIFKNPNPVFDATPFGLGHLDQANWNGIYYEKEFTVGNFSEGSGFRSIWFDNDESCFTNVYHVDCSFQVSYIHPNGIQYQWFKGDNPTSLSPGTYKVIVVPKFKHTRAQDAIGFNVNINWKETIDDPTDELLYGAGKRIGKIEYKDSINNKNYTKTYKYDDPIAGKTSGRLLGLSSFYSTKETVDLFGTSVPLLEPAGNVPGSMFGTYQGNTLGYEFVTEIVGDGSGTIGKTQYQFTMTPDGGEYIDFPYHPPTDNEWLRGKELKRFTYKKGINGAFDPVHSLETQYLKKGVYPVEGIDMTTVFSITPLRKALSENVDPAFHRMKDSTFFQLPIVTYTPGPENIVGLPGYKVYYFTGGTVDIDFTKEINYFDGESQIETLTTYGYNYAEHYNVKQVTQRRSDALETKTKYFYSQDTDSEVIGKPQQGNLSLNNMVEMPLVTQTFLEGQKLSEQETVFRDWDLGATFRLMPEIIKMAKGTAATENRVHYKMRDDKGNPMEVEQESGTKISYIWGYNKTLPVAKIENMAYTSIPTIRITDVVAASNAVPYVEANMITALDNLRNDPALANAMVTTYTYKPLVGVTTITDPKGDKITYHYDTFNRLQFVKDKDGKILSENQYHYRTQN